MTTTNNTTGASYLPDAGCCPECGSGDYRIAFLEPQEAAKPQNKGKKYFLRCLECPKMEVL